MRVTTALPYVLLWVGLVVGTGTAAEPLKLSVLFLGDNAGHQPRTRFALLEPVLAKKGIALTYTDQLDDLNLATLNKYDGLVIYANHANGKPEHVKAILDYTAAGKGFIPLHCASFCFTNDTRYIALVGAQFRSHAAGVFRVSTVLADHPIMKEFQSFESWDETYLHHKHNETDRTVLEVRTDGDLKEPWTWTRTHGKGRVFYTAWGHDARTWSHAGFHNLVERGIRWACGQDPAIAGPYVDQPKMKPITGNAKDFTYVDAKIPFYPPRGGAEAPRQMQQPLPPEKSRTHYTVPEGFELRLFASEELMQGGKPICMTWDERGRLWVGVTMDYPNELQKDGEGRDKILILEDTNGDGQADAVKVFAEKLSIPTSLLCVRGGVIVHQAPHTLFLKDSRGGDQCDTRKVLFTGWGTYDTHAGPSNLRYGPDHWIYGAVGYAGFSGSVAGEKHNFRQGFYRFKLNHKLEVEKLEFLRSTSNNTWGFCFNEQGEMFGSTANGCVLVHLAIPNRYYEKVKGLAAGVLAPIALDNRIHPVTERVRQVDWHGGFTAASHCAIYTARTYPPEYWNRTAFVSEPTGHLTATFTLQQNGTEYIARNSWNLAASRDEWAAPIDAQVGPDGHVWLLDWYNFIVQHNPTPAGFKNGKGNAYETDLRDKKHGRIYRIVYTKANPESMPNLQGAKADDLAAALKHHNMFWRQTAQRLIAEQSPPPMEQGPAIHLPDLSAPDARVRLRTLLAIADHVAHEKFGPALVEQLARLNPLTEKNLSDATVIAAVSQASSVFKSLAQAKAWSREGLTALELVAANYASQAPKDIGGLMRAVAGSPAAGAVLNGFAAGWPAGKQPVLTAADEAAVAQAIATATPATRGKLLKLATAWGVKGLDAQMAGIVQGALRIALDSKASESERIAAVKQVLEFGHVDEKLVGQLLATLTPESSPEFSISLLEALAASPSRVTGLAVVEKLPTLAPVARPVALRLILARPEATTAYLDAVEKGRLRFDLLQLDQKAALAAHPDPAIAERARKLLAQGGGLPNPDRQRVIEELSHVLKASGDAANGKKVFTTHCAKCHKHGSEGAQIGPDLTGFAVHPKEEILIHVLDPSRSVEGNYKAWVAKTLDGRVITGLLSSQSRTSVELLDAENKRHAISRDNLDELKESKLSLMPEGFEKQMKPQELTDLLSFMTQKGKYVPVPLDKVATVISTKDMFFDAGGDTERLIFRDWSPKEFAGVPFHLVDPQGDQVKNMVMLNGPNGKIPPQMPKSVTLPCNTPAKAIHFLSGVGGWNALAAKRDGPVSMIVRLHYADGKTEDHPLRDGEHFADYIRRVDVPGSKFAFALRGQQMRYLSIQPKRAHTIKQIELLKGSDRSAPIIAAITVETE